MLLLLALSAFAADTPEDPRLWLEDVEGDKAMEWVEARNAESTAELKEDGTLEPLQAKILEVLDSTEKIPYVTTLGDQVYNFWKDADHERGIWRRTTLEDYLNEEPEWETVFDLDALNAEEGENWVWHGADCLGPAYERCLFELSRGGADASVTREYDLTSQSFVEGGFELPEAKGGASWIDLDTVFVSTDFGEGSMTDSGYPRVAKIWTRGQPFDGGETVYEGDASDIAVGAWHDHTPGYERQFVYQSTTFYTNKIWARKKGKLIAIDKPDDAEMGVFKDWITFELRSDWEIEGTTYKAGSLIAAPYKKWLKGKKAGVVTLFEPTETTSLAGVSSTRDHLVLNILDNVRNRIEVHTPEKKSWVTHSIPGIPELGQVSVSAVDADHSNAFFLTVTDYLTPTSLWLGEIGGADPKIIKQLPSYFSADGLEVSQHFATSKDGTKIPYFQVAPTEIPEGGLPTLLYGYGGFEVSLLPRYSGSVGAGWLERGAVYVVANIRGGGEYGPRWHQAALKENRHKAYEDFAAVGEDLVSRGVTTAPQLGIMGGSNGGLLMGNMYTMYPDHWGAVVCRVPLLDMQRYTKLLAGASWAGEYGDPDVPEQWEYIQTFSPYHNIQANTDYPPILFTTSTRDDRVHPGHARKMAHALLEANKDVLYYENIEGGHGGAANNEQAAFMAALSYTFLWDELTDSDDADESSDDAADDENAEAETESE